MEKGKCHAVCMSPRSNRIEDLEELKSWVSNVIARAEKCGDTRKRAQFLELQEELKC